MMGVLTPFLYFDRPCQLIVFFVIDVCDFMGFISFNDNVLFCVINYGLRLILLIFILKLILF